MNRSTFAIAIPEPAAGPTTAVPPDAGSASTIPIGWQAYEGSFIRRTANVQ